MENRRSSDKPHTWIVWEALPWLMGFVGQGCDAWAFIGKTWGRVSRASRTVDSLCRLVVPGRIGMTLASRSVSSTLFAQDGW